jgi:hypothetical protein
LYNLKKIFRFVMTQSTQICMNFLLGLYECKFSYQKHEKFTKTILNGQ